MKKKIILLGVLFLLFMGLNAQTPYFYYYKGEKQYLELDTKHIFVSVIDENTAKTFALNNTNIQPLRADLPEKQQSKAKYKRFWTVQWTSNEIIVKIFPDASIETVLGKHSKLNKTNCYENKSF